MKISFIQHYTLDATFFRVKTFNEFQTKYSRLMHFNKLVQYSCNMKRKGFSLNGNLTQDKLKWTKISVLKLNQ